MGGATLNTAKLQTVDANGNPVNSVGGGTQVQWGDLTVMRGVDSDHQLYEAFKDAGEKGATTDNAKEIKLIGLSAGATRSSRGTSRARTSARTRWPARRQAATRSSPSLPRSRSRTRRSSRRRPIEADRDRLHLPARLYATSAARAAPRGGRCASRRRATRSSVAGRTGTSERGVSQRAAARQDDHAARRSPHRASVAGGSLRRGISTCSACTSASTATARQSAS